MNPDLRYELKLVCDSHWLPQARSWIQLHPAAFRVVFPSRQVNNFYLDTPSLDNMNANFSGQLQRSKLRLRWYGERTDRIRAWLELKRRENLLGFKRRFWLSNLIDLARSWIEILESVRNQIPNDWQWWLGSACQPALFNRYQREYYATPDDTIRATLDYAQFACDQRLSPYPNLSQPLPIPDTVIIEIKASTDHIEWLQEVVGHFPIPRSRNSKYVGGLRAALLTQ